MPEEEKDDLIMAAATAVNSIMAGAQAVRDAKVTLRSATRDKVISGSVSMRDSFWSVRPVGWDNHGITYGVPPEVSAVDAAVETMRNSRIVDRKITDGRVIISTEALEATKDIAYLRSKYETFEALFEITACIRHSYTHNNDTPHVVGVDTREVTQTNIMYESKLTDSERAEWRAKEEAADATLRAAIDKAKVAEEEARRLSDAFSIAVGDDRHKAREAATAAVLRSVDMNLAVLQADIAIDLVAAHKAKKVLAAAATHIIEEAKKADYDTVQDLARQFSDIRTSDVRMDDWIMPTAARSNWRLADARSNAKEALAANYDARLHAPDSFGYDKDMIASNLAMAAEELKASSRAYTQAYAQMSDKPDKTVFNMLDTMNQIVLGAFKGLPLIDRMDKAKLGEYLKAYKKVLRPSDGDTIHTTAVATQAAYLEFANMAQEARGTGILKMTKQNSAALRPHIETILANEGADPTNQTIIKKHLESILRQEMKANGVSIDRSWGEWLRDILPDAERSRAKTALNKTLNVKNFIDTARKPAGPVAPAAAARSAESHGRGGG